MKVGDELEALGKFALHIEVLIAPLVIRKPSVVSFVKGDRATVIGVSPQDSCLTVVTLSTSRGNCVMYFNARDGCLFFRLVSPLRLLAECCEEDE